MQSNLVSIIVPVFNRETTLAECITSILCQTYRNFELLIIDNNSTDRTREIIKEFQKNDPRVVYLFESYKSPAAARNKGISYAKGNIVAMTDSDCVVSKDWISTLIKPIVDDGELAVMGFETDYIQNFWSMNIQKADTRFYTQLVHNSYIAHIDTKNFAYKKKLFTGDVFDKNLRQAEDLDLYLRIRSKVKIKFSISNVVSHRHADTLHSVFQKYFWGGYWTKGVFLKHKDNLGALPPAFESFTVTNMCLTPLWLLHNFFKKPFGEASFDVVSECSWRLGALISLLNKK